MIDLHLHSTFSDGTFTPEELVKMARRDGLAAISVTDHDTVDGTEEAMSAAKKHGVRVISGVELSVFLDDVHFHLLGYNFNHRDKRLLDKLGRLQDSRNDRNGVIIDKLRTMGLDVSDAELQEISGGGQTGRPHIARLLVKKGIVKNIDQAFALYLRKGKPGYAPRYIYQAGEAIEFIGLSGGAAVLAHPAQISRQVQFLDLLLGRLKALGLEGVETYYPTHKGTFFKSLRRLAHKHGLFETGGSDYHGDIRPDTAMAGKQGNMVPCDVLVQMDRNLHLKREAI
jgi:predicted metal-dependent phosphoesterase TrpH